MFICLHTYRSYLSIINSGVLLDEEDVIKICLAQNIVSKHAQGSYKIKCSVFGALGLLTRHMFGHPKGLVVDHINGDRHDNRRCNLRAVTATQNMWNTKKLSTNKSGITGVYFEADRWIAEIVHLGKRRRKKFYSIEDASKWRTEKENELRGEFQRAKSEAEMAEKERLINVQKQIAKQLKEIAQTFGVSTYEAIAALANDSGLRTERSCEFTYQSVRLYMRNTPGRRRTGSYRMDAYEKLMTDSEIPLAKKKKIAHILVHQ